MHKKSYKFNGELMRRYRLRRGMSRAEVARAANIGYESMKSYEDGDTIPDVVVLRDTAAHLQLGMMEVCALLRYIPPGLDKKVFVDFIDACRSEQTPTSTVLADFIKAYVEEKQRRAKTCLLSD